MDGEKGGGGAMEVGEAESHFNVSVGSDGQSHN